MIVSTAFYQQLLLTGHEASCHRARMQIETGTAETLVRVRGEVDAATTHFLAAMVQRFLVTPMPLVIDLSEVKFLSVGAIVVLLDIEAQRGDRVRIITADDSTRRLLRLMNQCDAAFRTDRVSEKLSLVRSAAPNGPAPSGEATPDTAASLRLVR